MSGRKWLTVVAGVVVLSSALAACGDSDETPTQERELVYALPFADVVTLDPAKTVHGSDYPIIINVYSALLRPDLNNPSVILPDLARDYITSEDGTEITFFLRPGVQWHKGYGEVTAEDVAFTYERLKDESSGSIWAEQYAAITEIEVIDGHTVRFGFDAPNFGLEKGNINLFVGGRAGEYIVSKAAVEEVGTANYGPEPIGSGPFVFESYTPKQNLLLSANNDYYLGAPWLETINYVMMEEEATRNVALEAGEVDIAGPLSETEAIANFRDLDGFNVVRSNSSAWLYGVAINTKLPPFDDIRVRQALNYAVDTASVVNAVYGGPPAADSLHGPAPSPFPPSAEGWDPSIDWPGVFARDVEKAKALLTEAGFPNGLQTSLVTHPFVQHDVIMTGLQAQLAEAGIDTSVDVVDVATWREHMTAKDSPLIPIAGNFQLLWALYVSPDGPDSAPQYEGTNALFAQAWQEGDPVARAAIYQQIQEQLLADVPYIPLFTSYPLAASRDYVKGYVPSPLFEDYLYWVYFDPWPVDGG